MSNNHERLAGRLNMRVSSDEHDPGYVNFKKPVNVFLDGHLVDDVVTADEEKGYILKYIRINDSLVFNDKKTGAMIEELFGEVVIKDIDE